MLPTTMTGREQNYAPSQTRGRFRYIPQTQTLPDSVVESLREDAERGSRRKAVELFEGGACDFGEYSLEYMLDEEGNAVISECVTDAPSIRIPAEVEGHPVVALGSHSFSRCYKLTSVEIAAGLLEVGSCAFMNTALESFDSPKSLVTIGEKAFYKCRKLRSVTLHEGLACIEESAFENTGIGSLAIPSTVSFIGTSLVSGSALDLAPGSRGFTISPENPWYIFQDGCLYRRMEDGGLVLSQCLWHGIEHYESIPKMVCVGTKAFYQCKKLRRVHLNEGVTHLADRAFFGCEGLTELNFPDTLLSIGKNALCRTALTSLHIPASLEHAGTNAFCTLGVGYAHGAYRIRRISVDPANEHFYFETGLLCERRDGGDIALLHAAESTVVIVPEQVISIGPFALAEANSVDELVLHTGIRKLDVCCFAVGRPIPRVVIRGADVPGGCCLVQFPMTRRGAQAMQEALSEVPIDAERAYYYADRAICCSDTLFERSRAMVERLLSGQCLAPSMRNVFEDRLTNRLGQTVVEFGKRGYLAGIRTMADLGILTEDNIESATEAAVAADEIAASSCLMEIRRTRFCAPMFDFDL